jgi:tripartite-type tricarboxylate transporter receptor subunit TctC
VVLNRPGPGFVNSATLVAHADPDGYTTFLFGNGTVIATQLFRSLPYKLSSFKQVSTLAFFNMVLLVNKDSRFKTAQGLIAWAKAHPGKLSIGTISTGSTQNLAADLFDSMAHIKAQIIPYTSTSEVITALRGNQVQAAFEIMPPVYGQIKAGVLKALAVTGSTRFPGLPDVPTLAESGLKGYDATSWNALAVPAKTPDAVVETLYKEMAAVIATPEVKQGIEFLGAMARSSTPAQLTHRVNSESVKWKRIIEAAHIPLH